MKFNKGDTMSWKSTGDLAYRKLDDNDFGEWEGLNRKVAVRVTKDSGDVDYELHTELPGKRTGFKWTDQQVYDYYKGVMNFNQ